jgi:hypothetical protein
MDWPSAYRAYDDDTLVALANAGLLRRAAKDVEAGKICWSESTGNASTLEVDGQSVELDIRGPQHTRCNCPAPGLCKHILAAVLWLRTVPAKPSEAASAGGAVASSAGPSDPLADVLATESTILFKAAGVAATRQAAQTPAIALEWRVQGGALVMELADLGVTCRWIAGGGFAGMVSEVAAAQRKTVHLMALAALRLALGQPLAWPKGLVSTAKPPSESELTPGERAFLDQVRGTLHELLRTGLSHSSTLVSARLLALNMSARGEGLPLLAAMLRNLGGMVDLLVRHDHQAQERDALALMSRIDALCAAMLAAGVSPVEDGTDMIPTDLLPTFRGKLRRTFDATDRLELLPLGAYWWQTLGGARGLTLSFWDVQGSRLLQTSVARPDASDAAFTRQSAWSAQALWPGAGAAEQVCDSPLVLSQPRLADDNRLALGGTSRAQSLPAWRASDPRLGQLGIGDWAELAEHLRRMTGVAGGIGDTLLLRPAGSRTPVLNEAQQQLRWPMRDAEGRWIDVVLPLGPHTDKRAENLDRFAARQAALHALMVRMEQSHATTHLVPFAALTTDENGQVQVVSFDFSDEPARRTSLAQRIARLLQLRKDLAPPATSPTLAERLLQPVLQVLEAQAATGRMALTQSQQEQLNGAASPIAGVGLRTLSRALEAHCAASEPQTLLRLHRLSMWVLQLDGMSHTASAPG